MRIFISSLFVIRLCLYNMMAHLWLLGNVMHLCLYGVHFLDMSFKVDSNKTPII